MRRMLLLVVVALALAALAAPAHAGLEGCIFNCYNASTTTTK
jgi:hypothetical protein